MHVYCDVWQGVRHEFLAILQAMVVAFPDQREFQGLSGLHDTDIDSDFFENIRHIQVSRSLLVTVCVRCVFVHVHECLCVFVFSDFVCSVCVCIYVCVCVCVCMCVCVYTMVCTSACTAHMGLFSYAYIPLYLYLHLHPWLSCCVWHISSKTLH